LTKQPELDVISRLHGQGVPESGLGRHRIARNPKTAEVVPSASRLIDSLRDLGYHATEAVADLVDNSIAAGARNVDVTIEFEGSNSWIRIADDGHGMNAATITEAMRYGSNRGYEANDLGKFGLGLKTASMSICRRLTVASRPSSDSRRAEVRQLNLEHVERTDAWEVLVLGADERPKQLIEPLKDHRGTVILWEDLDRLLVYNDNSGGWARRHLLDLAAETADHLSMIFHRFLAGEVPGRKLEITVNEEPLEPWDPFARTEGRTESLQVEEVPLNTASGSGIVRMEPYVLPTKAGFSSEAAWRRLSGPNQWNRQQGFYVYRADRLIQSGGWSYMRTFDEHTKLARIGIFFGPDLDSAFGINVAKMRVTLPPELRSLIEEPVGKAVRRARAVYDSKPDQEIRSSSRGKRGGGKRAGNGAADASASPREYLELAADQAGERPALHKIAKALKGEWPDVARELGW
jgi:histidine kinase/DNA gyrase B/HSP90-like ATPase